MTTVSFQQLAGGNLVLEHDGKSYNLVSMGMRQWAEFCQFVGFLDYHKAKLNDPPEDILKELFKQGLNAKLQIDSPEVLRALNNPIAVCKLLEISLELGNPGITKTTVNKIIGAEEYIQIIPQFLDLLGLSITPKETTEGNEVPPN